MTPCSVFYASSVLPVVVCGQAEMGMRQISPSGKPTTPCWLLLICGQDRTLPSRRPPDSFPYISDQPVRFSTSLMCTVQSFAVAESDVSVIIQNSDSVTFAQFCLGPIFGNSPR